MTSAYVQTGMGNVMGVSDPDAGSFGTINYTASTFSRWSGAMGVRQNFNRLEIDVEAFDGAALPTQIRVQVRDGSETGAILGDRLVLFTAISPTIQRLTVDFDKPILNGAGDPLCLVVLSDGHFGLRKLLSVVYPNPPHPVSKYGTDSKLGVNADGALSWSINSTNENYYVKTSLVDRTQARLQSPAAAFVSAIAGLYAVNITLPDTIYALSGREKNIYYDNIIRPVNRLTWADNDYDIQVSCSKGTAQNYRWTFVPADGDAGTYTLTITARFLGVVVGTRSVSLVVKSSVYANTVGRKLLAIGDSTTAGGEVLSELTNLLSTDAKYALTTVGGRSVTTVDSGGTSRTVSHEAVSGKTIAWHYANTGAVVTTDATGDGSNFRGGTKLTAGLGAGAVSLPVLGTAGLTVGATVYVGFGTANCEALVVSGTTGTTITVPATAKTHSSGDRVWWDSGVFSFANFLTNFGLTMTAGDTVSVHLGINDVFNLTSDASALSTAQTMLSQLTAMITSIQSAVAGARVLLLMVSGPSHDQDAFGANYGASGQYRTRYNRNRMLWLESLYTAKTALTGSGIYLVDYHAANDGRNNMQTVTVQVNSRNPATVARQANGVHPAPAGYYQLADALHSYLKGLES